MSCEPKVCNLAPEVRVEEDIFLEDERMNYLTKFDIKARTPFKSPCTIPSE